MVVSILNKIRGLKEKFITKNERSEYIDRLLKCEPAKVTYEDKLSLAGQRKVKAFELDILWSDMLVGYADKGRLKKLNTRSGHERAMDEDEFYKVFVPRMQKELKGEELKLFMEHLPAFEETIKKHEKGYETPYVHRDPDYNNKITIFELRWAGHGMSFEGCAVNSILQRTGAYIGIPIALHEPDFLFFRKIMLKELTGVDLIEFKQALVHFEETIKIPQEFRQKQINRIYRNYFLGVFRNHGININIIDNEEIGKEKAEKSRRGATVINFTKPKSTQEVTMEL